jgi:cellulose synthase (UDP-forming)
MAPIIYLLIGIAPINAWSVEFILRLFPYLIINKLMFMYVARGMNVTRGEQYSVALFPLWIQAVSSVITGARLKFVVTPKQRQSGNYLRLVWPQALIIGLTAVSIGYGFLTYALGAGTDLTGVLINTLWGGYNIWMLSAIVRAAVYRPPDDWDPRPPAFLFPETTADRAE